MSQTAQDYLDKLRTETKPSHRTFTFYIAAGVLLIALALVRLARATEHQGQRVERISDVMLRVERAGGFRRQ